MNKNFSAILFSVAIIIAALVLGWAIINRNNKAGEISVTGLGETDFISDLIVWEGSFEKSDFDLKQAYADLEKDKLIIIDYLVSKGIKRENLVFNSVNTNKNTRGKYNFEGKYMGEEFLGYILTQTVQIESKEVEKIEKISREITELLNKGVQFYSQPPRYYYTKLADLKIEMVSKATEDARVRAEKIAENSGATIGKLISADLGIFQITGQNSNEDYSWGGTFNTSSKAKTASITMKLRYGVK
ncbi:MAG TPA: SIMPL domain-containing protein [Fulvivirga sp.]|nr:SIMPL domain-containing protein [Fulvivirga sp.]